MLVVLVVPCYCPVMTDQSAYWNTINAIAREQGVKSPTRTKWRQRGVPHIRRLKIRERAVALGIDIPEAAFNGKATS